MSRSRVRKRDKQTPRLHARNLVKRMWCGVGRARAQLYPAPLRPGAMQRKHGEIIVARFGADRAKLRARRIGLTTMDALSAAMTKISTTATPKRATPASYEDALVELERLVATMEAGQLPLDQLLGSYQRGAELLGYCRSRLQAVESQVKLLEDGELKVWEGS